MRRKQFVFLIYFLCNFCFVLLKRLNVEFVQINLQRRSLMFSTEIANRKWRRSRRDFIWSKHKGTEIPTSWKMWRSLSALRYVIFVAVADGDIKQGYDSLPLFLFTVRCQPSLDLFLSEHYDPVALHGPFVIHPAVKQIRTFWEEPIKI